MSIYKALLKDNTLLVHGDIIIGTDNNMYEVMDAISSNTSGCGSCCFYNLESHRCKRQEFRDIIVKSNYYLNVNDCICAQYLIDFCHDVLVGKEGKKYWKTRQYCFKKLYKGI